MNRIAVMPTDSMFTLFAQLPNRLLTMVGSTFFDVIVDKYNSPVISNNLHGSQWKNHIFERCIGPEFIEKIHDAHIKKCDPNTIPSGSEYEPIIMFTIILLSSLWL